MPAGDRTGPWGLGPRTGRRLGYCSGFQYPGFTVPGRGMGLGRRFGLGRGFGRGMGRGGGRGFRAQWFNPFWGYATPPLNAYPYPASPWNREQEEAMLSEQAECLEEEMRSIQQRLKDLRKAGAEKKDAKPA